MYTLALKELDLNPHIDDEMVVFNKDIVILLNYTEKLIESRWPGLYNPYTLRRKIYVKVKNEKGKTYADDVKERFAKYIEEDSDKFMETQERKHEKFRKGIEHINKKYKHQCEELYKEWEAECGKTLTQKGKAEVDDKYETMHDDYAWERDKAEVSLKRILDTQYVGK